MVFFVGNGAAASLDDTVAGLGSACLIAGRTQRLIVFFRTLNSIVTVSSDFTSTSPSSGFSSCQESSIWNFINAREHVAAQLSQLHASIAGPGLKLERAVFLDRRGPVAAAVRFVRWAIECFIC